MLNRYLCFFGITLLVFNLNAQQQLTPRLIFDFDQGDLFHYHQSDYYNFSYQGGFSIKILGKLVSIGNDSITYYIQKNSYSQAMDQNTGQFTDTVYYTLIDTITYTNLDTDIALLPQYNIATYQAYQNYYDSYAAMDSSCLFGMNFNDTLNDWNLNGVSIPSYYSSYEISPSSCNSFVSHTKSNRFGKGIGQIAYYQSYSGGPYYGNSFGMIYFKKDTIESGMYDVFLSQVDEIGIPQLSLYPNPCNNDFFVALSGLPKLPYSLRLFSVQGQLVEVFNIQKTSVQSFDVSNLPAGMYMYQLHHSGNIQKQGKLLIER